MIWPLSIPTSKIIIYNNCWYYIGQKKKVLSVFKSKKQSNSTDTPKTKNKQKQLPSRKAVNDYTPPPNKDYYLDPVNTSYNEVIDRQSKADMNIYEGLDDEDYYSVSK